jgi:flagellar M-ring protein FliF
LPFTPVAAEPAFQPPSLLKQPLVYLVPAVVAAILILFVWRRRRKTVSLDELARAEIVAREAAATEEDPEVAERERIRKEVERLARQRPEELAQLLTTWISE